MGDIFEFFNKLILNDYKCLVGVYNRDPRDDQLDKKNSKYNKACACQNEEALNSLKYLTYNQLHQTIRQRGVSKLNCDEQLASVEVDIEAEHLNFDRTKIKHLSVEKKCNTPFKLLHLSAATVVNNSDRFDVQSLAALYIICSNSNNIRHLTFRAGPQDERRVYNISSILKNLIYPRLLYRTIQSHEYYNNLRIDLRPFCSDCNGLTSLGDSYRVDRNNNGKEACSCMVCQFVFDTFFSILGEINGHFGACMKSK